MSTPFDFADPAQAARLPRHGWAKNSQGVKLLWLPIIRLVNEAPNIRRKKGVTKELSPKQWSEIAAFVKATQHLAIALRELHKYVRIGTEPAYLKGSQKDFHDNIEASLLIPVFVDLVFVYLRRLADRFASSSRHVVFKHSGSAPNQYKKLKPLFDDKNKLQRLEPLCDIVRLQEAFAQHSGWFNELRNSTDDAGELQKGIRDIMEHHPVFVTVQNIKVGEGPWEGDAFLQNGTQVICRDLIRTLKDIIDDITCLWTEFCIAASYKKSDPPWIVPYGDVVMLMGNDDDATGFWPEI